MVKPETVPRSRNLVKLFVDAGKGKTKQGVAGILMYAFQTSWEEDKSP
jgi:tRNA-binding EMAP/Myf-like protein